jgi:hypothetical protein
MIRFVMAALVGLFATFSSTATFAQTVFSNVEGVNGGVLTSDPQGPSGSAVSSGLSFAGSASLDFSQDGFGKAAQRPDGVGAVLADALFANGMIGNYVEARTTWSDTATNNSGGSIDYSFNFLITPPSLRIGDYAGLADTSSQRPDISFHVTISANSAIVFEAEAHLIGGDVSHVLIETGTSLNPTFVAGSDFGYDFQPYSDTIGLGTVADGSSITVEYEMVARVDTPGYEAGGRAQIGDPFDLDGTPGFSGAILPDQTVAIENTLWGHMKNLYR